MVKASALYIVIIITLVIGLICSSLIVAAYFYKDTYQRKFRYDQLENNLNSGVNILLSSPDNTYTNEKTSSLFGGDADSVLLKQLAWGIFDVDVTKAFIFKDTLFKTFEVANTIDSSKWAAIYLIDQDRPFSVSGKTTITGDVYIPKAGVQAAYVNNQAYSGDKRLIIGTKRLSGKSLPPLDPNRLKQLQQEITRHLLGDSSLAKTDSLQQSFLQSTRVFNFRKKIQTIDDIKLSGNIILFSDTTITINSTAVLDNIIIFAKAIAVKSGFTGNCQLFATDSIYVEDNCRFEYPSCLGILRFQTGKTTTQEKISLGKNTSFSGTLFTYEQADNILKPTISIGNQVTITGQVYSQGLLELKDLSEVDGSVFTSLFYYKNAFTVFENYLINTTINSKSLSSYYLTSALLPVAKQKKKVLQWLESN